MIRRVKAVVAYDGTSHAGWQSQPNRNGIQDHIEQALARLTGERIRVHGSGRTDAGVHAFAQVAHFDLANERWAPKRLRDACNALLPPTIRVMHCARVSKTFHARFSARSKMYRYRICNGAVLPPLEIGRAWHVRHSMDHALLEKAAALFNGTHDFAGFAANRGHEETDTTRTIRRIAIRHAAGITSIEIEADGFLYKMARLIVGALIEVAAGKTALTALQEQIERPRLQARRPSAPAHGLFLVRVRY